MLKDCTYTPTGTCLWYKVHEQLLLALGFWGEPAYARIGANLCSDTTKKQKLAGGPRTLIRGRLGVLLEDRQGGSQPCEMWVSRAWGFRAWD